MQRREMVYFLYFIVVLIVTFIGTITGIGGMLILNPLLKLFTNISLSQIIILTSMTALMITTIQSILLSYKSRSNIRLDALFIIFGSILGAYLSKLVYLKYAAITSNDVFLLKVQSLVMILVLLFTYLSFRGEHRLSISRNWPSLIFSGLIMGFISAFIGVDAIAFNVLILLISFNYSSPDALLLSSLSIMFSQLVGLITLYLNEAFKLPEISLLILTILAGLIATLFGQKQIGHLPDKFVRNIFISTTIILVLVNVINIVV